MAKTHRRTLRKGAAPRNRAPFVPLTCVSESRSRARKPFHSVFPSAWPYLGSSRPSWLWQRARNCRSRIGTGFGVSALRRVQMRAKPSQRAFKGAPGGSSPVSLSNVPTRSLSYTWSRFQRLKKAPCVRPWRKRWGCTRIFHELLRFPSAFSTSELRSRAGTDKRYLPRLSTGFHLRTTRRVCSSPKNRTTGFRTRCAPYFPPRVEVLFQTGNTPGIPH